MEKLQLLLDKLDTAAAITYIAVNAQGDVRSNMKEDSVNAVTWDVFPGWFCLLLNLLQIAGYEIPFMVQNAVTWDYFPGGVCS
jgi:hypothetical protein